LFTPEASPAWSAFTASRAAVVSDAVASAMPKPCTTSSV
jgi:hypothetical protein